MMGTIFIACIAVAAIALACRIIIRAKGMDESHDWSDDPDPQDAYWLRQDVEEMESPSGAVVASGEVTLVVDNAVNARAEQVKQAAITMAAQLSQPNDGAKVPAPVPAVIEVRPTFAAVESASGRPGVKEVKQANTRPTYQPYQYGHNQYSAYKYQPAKKEEPLAAELVMSPEVGALVAGMVASDVVAEAAAGIVAAMAEPEVITPAERFAAKVTEIMVPDVPEPPAPATVSEPTYEEPESFWSEEQ